MNSRRLIRAIRRTCRVISWMLILPAALAALIWVMSGWLWMSTRVGNVGVMASQGVLFITTGNWKDNLRDSTFAGGMLPGRLPAWKMWAYWVTPPATPAPASPAGAPAKAAATAVAFYASSRWDCQWSLAAPTASVLLVGFGFRWLGKPRNATGTCLECGYDLAGLPSRTCPECGTVDPVRVSKRGRAMPSVSEDKLALRRRFRALLAAVPADRLREQSAMACDRAAGLIPPGATVMLYAPMPGTGEIDLGPLAGALLAQGCRLCIPRVFWSERTMVPARVMNLTSDLVPDPGESRPFLRPRPDAPVIPVGELDAVVIPGLAFDRTGARLGRGAGFYDRFLASLPAGRPVRIALALGEQLIDRVPMEAHDQRLDVIVTPDEVIRPTGSAPLAADVHAPPETGRNT